jgi:hypothetical protein
MAYSVRDIIDTVNKNGVLPTNKFLVRFAPPLVLQNISIAGAATGETTKLIELRAEQAKIPGISIMSSDINRYGYGPPQKMPFNAQFTETSLTFLADKDGALHRFFYTWMRSIFDFAGVRDATNVEPSYKTEYKDNYCTDLYVYVYDNWGKNVQNVVMKKAFPVSFNEVSLGWSQNNEVMKLSLGMTFRDWTLEGVSSSAPELPETPSSQSTTYSSGPR